MGKHLTRFCFGVWKTSLALLLLLCTKQTPLQAQEEAFFTDETAPRGRIEIAPAFLHLDILESGHTVKRMDMWGIRAEVGYRIWKGLFIKPSLIYGEGGASKGGTFTGTVLVGHYVPLTSNLAVAPSAGISYCHLWTEIDLPQYKLKNLKEKFRSVSPIIGLECYYKISPDLRVSATVQYSWSNTRTTISHLGTSKSKSKGFIYSFSLEKDLNAQWSLNVGAAYNLSLTKERHGLRASGIKVGLARWF